MTVADLLTVLKTKNPRALVGIRVDDMIYWTSLTIEDADTEEPVANDILITRRNRRG